MLEEKESTILNVINAIQTLTECLQIIDEVDGLGQSARLKIKIINKIGDLVDLIET
jgi:hypothetical protein